MRRASLFSLRRRNHRDIGTEEETETLDWSLRDKHCGPILGVTGTGPRHRIKVGPPQRQQIRRDGQILTEGATGV